MNMELHGNWPHLTELRKGERTENVPLHPANPFKQIKCKKQPFITWDESFSVSIKHLIYSFSREGTSGPNSYLQKENLAGWKSPDAYSCTHVLGIKREMFVLLLLTEGKYHQMCMVWFKVSTIILNITKAKVITQSQLIHLQFIRLNFVKNWSTNADQKQINFTKNQTKIRQPTDYFPHSNENKWEKKKTSSVYQA